MWRFSNHLSANFHSKRNTLCQFILNTSIRTLDNLYSLNDFHVVGGAEKRHQPALFLRLDTTQELIKEIEQNSDLQICRSVKSLRTGINKGTWVCEELALAYATWISPKFHLVVLRAFIAMHKGEVQTIQPTLPLVAPNDEEALNIIVNLFHALNGAYDMGDKLRNNAPHLAKQIDNTIGGHYIYNLNHPTYQTLKKAKDYIQAKSERIMFVKGMLSLLEQSPC